VVLPVTLETLVGMVLVFSVPLEPAVAFHRLLHEHKLLPRLEMQLLCRHHRPIDSQSWSSVSAALDSHFLLEANKYWCKPCSLSLSGRQCERINLYSRERRRNDTQRSWPVEGEKHDVEAVLSCGANNKTNAGCALKKSGRGDYFSPFVCDVMCEFLRKRCALTESGHDQVRWLRSLSWVETSF
jgi:hypothetical protein